MWGDLYKNICKIRLVNMNIKPDYIFLGAKAPLGLASVSNIVTKKFQIAIDFKNIDIIC